MSSDNKDHHAQGQKDAKDGKHSPPHDNPRDNLCATYSDKEIKNHAEYKAGWKNAKK